MIKVYWLILKCVQPMPATLFFWYFHCFPLRTHNHLRDIFLMLHCLFGTISLAKSNHQTHSHPSNIVEIFKLLLTVCLCVCALAEVCFDCASFLCFVMGYVPQFGEIAHKRAQYYFYVGSEFLWKKDIHHTHMQTCINYTSEDINQKYSLIGFNNSTFSCWSVYVQNAYVC